MYSKHPLFRYFLLWWIICAVIQTIVITQYNIDLWHAALDGIGCSVLLAGCTLLIINNIRYYTPRNEKYAYLLFLSAALSGIYILVARYLLGAIFSSDEYYLQFLKQSLGLRYAFIFLVIECTAMFCLIWYGQQEQNRLAEKQAETLQHTKDAELYKLRQQLQPHFLFNSLNSISALIGSQPEKARHMIQQLSDFLRNTIKKEEQHWTTLKEELDYLTLYLDIEKVRFGHRLNANINYDKSTEHCSIPPLILQPVVENAIKFGLYDTIEPVTISLQAFKIEDRLHIIISNPFDPETSSTAQGTGFGLKSIKRRLFLVFSRNDLLQTSINKNIFITTLIIPQIYDQSSNNR